MFRYLLLGLLFSTLGLAQDKAVTDAVKRELEKFQGTWQLVSTKVIGSNAPRVPDELVKLISSRYEGDREIVIYDGVDNKDVKKVIKLDPTKTPKEIDTYVEYMGKKKVIRGIYIIDGDTLTTTSGEDDGPRPTSFETKGQTVGIAKRVKK